MDEPHIYEICIEDHLSKSWYDWFDGLTIRNESSGETILSGPFVDQAALFGTLTKIHSLNLTLVSVNRSPYQK